MKLSFLIMLATGSLVLFTNAITNPPLAEVIVSITKANEVVVYESATQKLYVLQTASKLAEGTVRLNKAQLYHDESHLWIKTSETMYYLGLDAGEDFLQGKKVPKNHHFQGYGLGIFIDIAPTIIDTILNHNSIYEALSKGGASNLCSLGTDFCHSGGDGALSCAVSNESGSCTVTCAAGHYACCNNVTPICKCCAESAD